MAARLVIAGVTPVEAQRELASRARAVRLELRFTQATLATRAGVALPTLRRFERTGEVSLKYLLRIAHALGRLDEFTSILRPAPPMTMAELEALVDRPRRQRGSV